MTHAFASAVYSEPLERVSISQSVYNIFLLEKTAAHILSDKYLKIKNQPTRKLLTKDYLSSFNKTARDNNIALKDYSDKMPPELMRAVMFKYGLDLSPHIDKSIRDVCDFLAKNSHRERGNVVTERRK